MNTTRRTSRTLLPLAAVTALALGAAACGSDDETDSAASDTTDVSAVDGEVTVADAWSRQPAAGQSSAAIYGVVTNGTDETITAVSATSSVTDTVELHEVVMVDNEMSMREKEGGYEIAPGESLLFEPGGAHIMLIDIDPATYPDTIDIVLTFDDGTSIEFEAEVRALDGEDAAVDSGMDMEDSEG